MNENRINFLKIWLCLLPLRKQPVATETEQNNDDKISVTNERRYQLVSITNFNMYCHHFNISFRLCLQFPRVWANSENRTGLRVTGQVAVNKFSMISYFRILKEKVIYKILSFFLCFLFIFKIVFRKISFEFPQIS